MGRVNKGRFEAMAQGVAAGQTTKAAAIAAGYTGTATSYYQVAKRADFKARVKVLEQERLWGGSSDLAPAINLLMRGAEKALTLNSPAALNAAARMIAEAARLKQLLPPPPVEARRRNYEMPREEWLATYAPKPS
jgi:uncharacterized membrane protein